MTDADISRIAFVRSTPVETRSGLLGWCSFTLGNLIRIDGVTVRRTRTGRLALGFPSRRDRAGIAHPYLRPVDDVTRRQLEDAVFEALGIDPQGGHDGR